MTSSIPYLKQYPETPESKFINSMANIIHISKITKITLTRPPTDYNKQFTSIFKLGLLLINLKGLNILSILTILINPSFYPLRPISIIENNTIIKSN